MDLVDVFVKDRLVANSLLHVRDVVLASADIISEVAELSHFLAQKAVKCSSRLEEAPLLAPLRYFITDLVRKCAQCRVVWSQLQLVIFDCVLGSDGS